MQSPLQITFRDTNDPTGAIEAKIRERAERLDKFYNNIIGCQVVVESPHQHQHKGNIYKVRINLSVPKHTLVVSNEGDHNHAYEDVYVAVRDAFDAMNRKLEEFGREQRGDVKQHDSHRQSGSISALFPDNDSGRIVTADGRDVYFHRNSLINAEFETLTEGMAVEYVEEMGDEGLQASAVKVL